MLQDSVNVITRLVKKVKEVASHAVQGFEDRNADIKGKILSMVKVLRRRTRESWEEVDKITQSVIEITETVVTQATAVLEKIQDKGRQNIKDGMLLDAVRDHKRRFGKAPKAVATDRGFSGKQNDMELEQEGVLRRSLPRKGKKGKKRSEYEKEPWFQDLQRFRAAGKAKISLLKRKYGLDRSRYRGYANTKSWVGFGIFTHNLVRAAKMLRVGTN